MWVKDYHKLLLFDIRTETFVEDLRGVLERLGISDTLKNMFMDGEGGYWFLTSGDRLVHSVAGSATVFVEQVSQCAGKDNPLYDLAVIDDRLYLFYRSGDMICFDVHANVEVYRENPFGKAGSQLYKSTLHVVPYKQYLYQVRNGSQGKGIVHRFNVKNRKWDKILETDNALNTLSVDDKGNCWISTHSGFWFIDEYLTQVRHIPGLRLVDGKVLETQVNTQFSDADGGLWVGTRNRGLLYYHPDRYRFTTFSRTHFKIPDDEELEVYSFADGRDKIWVGTNRGLYMYERTDSSRFLVPDLLRFDGIPRDAHCSWVFEDTSQRLWICTGNGYGLYCISGGKVRNYVFPFESIYYLCESFTGSLYLCGSAGFGLFDPDTGIYNRLDGQGQPDLQSVYQLVEYGQERFLGVSGQGIFVYDIKNRQIKLPGSTDKKHPMLRQNNHKCHCLFIDSRGLIWFGTQDGLNVWNEDAQRLYSFHTEDGLVNNCIFSIIEDPLQRIWLSTANGISRIDVDNENIGYKFSFINYNKYDGLMAYEYLPRAALLTRDGRLLCGGLEGFNGIDLKRIASDQQQLSSPVFLEFFLSGEAVKQGQKYDGRILLKQSITVTKNIVLNYHQNFFGLEFSALNYVNPTQTYYRYCLEGVDNGWQNLVSDDGLGRVNYTNLSPGTYTFKVYAANNSHRWSDQCAQLTITITPPFWRTSVAYAVYFMMLVLGVYLTASWWYKRNKRKMRQMQKEELDQMKFRFFTNISHELRTPLTLILTPLETVIKKVDDSRIQSQLEGIHRNALNLLRLVNQLLDFRKLEMNGEKVTLNLCNVEDFIKAISLPFEEVMARKGISFNSYMEPAKIQFYVDTDKLYKIINNLLSNACKFTPSGGTITLDIKLLADRDEAMICFKITDTGCGIPEVDVPHIFTRFYQVKGQNGENTGSGIGLHLVQEYVHLLGGTVEVDSKEGKGSVFTVCLPANLHPVNRVEREKSEQDKRNLKIMLVEDNEDFLAFLDNELSEKYGILTASNGKEALKLMAQDVPDLIVSDLMMPEMNGLEFCRQIKNEVQTSHIPFILLTARSSEDVQIEAYEAGIDACIGKPFNMDILLLQIKHLIEQQEKRKELFRKSVVITPETVVTTPVDESLLKKALACIEKNLANPSYSVEQFSKDMCMDRTGLYRKLMALSGQSPTMFIRSIRLKRSTQLLEQGRPVAEVADMVGFGTASYFSKCFQEEYGVKPSQYVVRK